MMDPIRGGGLRPAEAQSGLLYLKNPLGWAVVRKIAGSTCASVRGAPGTLPGQTVGTNMIFVHTITQEGILSELGGVVPVVMDLERGGGLRPTETRKREWWAVLKIRLDGRWSKITGSTFVSVRVGNPP